MGQRSSSELSNNHINRFRNYKLTSELKTSASQKEASSSTILDEKKGTFEYNNDKRNYQYQNEKKNSQKGESIPNISFKHDTNSKIKSHHQSFKDSHLTKAIKSKFKANEKAFKLHIESRYDIPRLSSNSSSKHYYSNQNEMTWLEYAEKECLFLQTKKQVPWTKKTINLLACMKRDVRVIDFQKNALLSLIITIESMNEFDYLADIPINELSNGVQTQSLFEQKSGDYTDQSIGGIRDTQIFGISNDDDDIDDQKPNNMKTLVENIPLFEEELHENVQGRKTYTNIIRREVITFLTDERPLQYEYRQSRLSYNNYTQLQNIQKHNQQHTDNIHSEYYLEAHRMINFYKAVYIFLEKSFQHQHNPLRALMKFYKKYFLSTYSPYLQKNILLTGVVQPSQLNSQKEVQTKDPSNQTRTNQLSHPTLKNTLNQQRFDENSFKPIQIMEDDKNKLQTQQCITNKCNEDVLINKNEQIISQQKAEQNNIIDLVEKMIQDIQQFIHFLLYCMIFFYDFDNILSDKKYGELVNKENMWNFLINLLFTDQEVHSMCFQLLRQSLIPNEDSLREKMKSLSSLNPEDFEINPKLCLNEKTLEWYKHGGKNKKAQVESPLENTCSQTTQKIDGKQFSGMEKVPYLKAIKKLRSIVKYNSPIHKMKLLVQFFELISLCVQEFYLNELNEDSNQNMIASDDLINILVFIVIKSGVSQLSLHLKLISSFICKNLEQNKIGYYCTSLQIVAAYLESDKVLSNFPTQMSPQIQRSLIELQSSFKAIRTS